MPTTSEPAIRCTGLGKSFVLGSELSLQRTLLTVVGRGGRLPRFDALRDVSFTVGQGEFFGIVGANGSGKSTLTQILSGITPPSSGLAETRGRVLPLLEIGAGFHQELTGAENVSLLGTILGLTPREVGAALPRIAEFSGVETHLDTPLKRYSSGMRARLGFATAVCLPADVYVFDEVLAVVDDDFRDRCADELRALNAAGRTVVFMSHDLALVRSLCSTGMWLHRGHVRLVGDIDEVAEAYAHGGEVEIV